jgi:ribosomal protein S18 acetylase RimI-like enzyme
MSGQSFSIRRATIADAPIITAHRRKMFEDMGRGTLPQLDAMDAKFAPWVSSKIACGEYLAWFVVNERDAVVAGAGLILLDQTPSPLDLSEKRGYILNVYVDRDYRRRGLARRLMTMILDHSRAEKIRMIALHASDEGRPLYESLGFKPTNEMRLRL